MVRAAAALAAGLAATAVLAAAGAAQQASSEVVFVARKGHASPHFVYGVRADGSRLHQLPLGKATAAYWSPTGKKVAVVATKITIRNPDGTGSVVLPAKCAGGCDVAWAPGGERLVYAVVDKCGKALCPSRLVSVRSDGKDRRVLLRFTGANVTSPSWAPDGSLIAFVESAGGVADLDVVRRDGTGFTRLAPVDGTAYSREYHPSWTANAKRILFSAARGGGVWVLSVARDGGDLRTLATGSLPVVSPDGKRVAFLRNGGAYVMAVSGGQQTQVAAGVASGLAWSPDGDRLAYLAKDSKVGVAQADGSGSRTVTKTYDTVLCVSWRTL